MTAKGGKLLCNSVCYKGMTLQEVVFFIVKIIKLFEVQLDTQENILIQMFKILGLNPSLGSFYVEKFSNYLRPFRLQNIIICSVQQIISTGLKHFIHLFAHPSSHPAIHLTNIHVVPPLCPPLNKTCSPLSLADNFPSSPQRQV